MSFTSLQRLRNFILIIYSFMFIHPISPCFIGVSHCKFRFVYLCDMNFLVTPSTRYIILAESSVLSDCLSDTSDETQIKTRTVRRYRRICGFCLIVLTIVLSRVLRETNASFKKDFLMESICVVLPPSCHRYGGEAINAFPP